MSNNILVTGSPGSGKTTLIEKLVNPIPDKKGFVTREIRKSGRRTGFEIITSDGERKLLAGIDIDSPYRVSKYKVDVRGFEVVIDRFFTFSNQDVLYIDEIGKMELFSDGFRKLVRLYLEADNLFIATIALKATDTFIDEVKQRKDVQIFTIDHGNRNTVYSKLANYLKENRYG